MADYVSREVARENLRKACKGGTLLSAIVMVLGLFYGGIAAIVGFNVKLPFEIMYTALNVAVPTMSDATIALADCATKAVLLVLMGFVGILMFRKVSKTGDAFRVGQLKQLKFVAFLSILLGFMPAVVSNILKVVLSVRAGGQPLAVMSFAIEPMCILVGFVMFAAARVLVAGSRYGSQEEELSSDPYVAAPEPDFAGVPDLGNVPTASVPDDEAGLEDTAWRPPRA